MSTIQEPAFAKLNLTLDVLGLRPDRYHEMEMVMQSVTLCDQLTLAPQEGRTTARTNLSFLPTGDKNLAVMAANHFYQALGIPPKHFDIHIEKHIPVCAGLAGGSSDGSAVLRALNRLEGSPFTPLQLAEIGEKFGSDVPYCVVGGTALAKGRGEVLSPLPPCPHCWVVLCKPPFPVSTPELFSRIDSTKITCRPDTVGMIAALEAGDLGGVAHRLFNVFEGALPRSQHQTVEEIKSALIQLGALGSTMSGSGPTVFGLFDDQQRAKIAYDTLRQSYQETFLAETV